MIKSAGDTLFARVRNLEDELRVRRLYVKFEGSNPTGTQKDRIAQAAYLDAHEKGYSAITVATCGNFGASIAYACRANGVRPVVYIPHDYRTNRVAEMERAGARIVRVAGDYEDAVVASRAAAAENGWYDANPGPRNWDVARRAYGAIAREILDALGTVPDTVSVSVGNGTTLAGIHDGFVELRRAGVVDRVPAMIGASTPRGNPIVAAYRRGLREPVDLDPSAIRETAINEPLTNWHSFDGDRALAAIYASSGGAAYASDAAMRRLATALRDAEGISVLEASCAALEGLSKFAKRAKGLDVEDGQHVVVLTGRSASRVRGPVAEPAARSAPAPVPAAPREVAR